MQVGGFIRKLRRSAPEDRVRSTLLSNLQKLVADLGYCLVPADALPLAANQLGRIFKPPLAMGELPCRRALGAVSTHIDGTFEHGFLTHPDAVLNLCPDRASDRAERTNGLLELNGCTGRGGTRRALRGGPHAVQT